MIFTAIIMFVLALLGVIVFDSKILFGILMLLCAAGVLANELILKKLMKKNYLRFIIFGGLTAAFLACAILPGPRTISTAKTLNSADEGSSFEEEGTDSEDDEEYFKAAREYADKEEYDKAEQELAHMSDGFKKTEAYYILRDDIETGKNGFDNNVNQKYLNFLINAVRDCPESLILNYKAGITAYALNRYNTAESYLFRAYELAPEEDPYTPYALAAVYKNLGEDEYAYAFMTIAEKNGILDTGECDGEGIVDWYRELKKELNETEAAK